MFNVLAVVSSVVLSTLGQAAFGQALIIEPVTPPTENVEIEVVTVNGSGCPIGTAAVAVSEDNRAFTVTYSDYLAMVGVGASPIDFRKNCQLNILVHVPNGFTYAIAEVDYRGFGSLADGAIATEKANYYFQGMTPTAAVTHTLAGPYEDNWQFNDSTELIATSYAPCGEPRNLNINTELRVSAGTSDTSTTTSFMVMDSLDTDISTVYHFAWKECPAE